MTSFPSSPAREDATSSGPVSSPEIWGGIEPTVNRVGDHYLDQLVRTGHATRLEDLDLFQALGIKAIRYPVLWERTAPDGIETADWSWPDIRVNRLRELGIRPIVGLIHHGSGPRDTSLIDPAFPGRLAEYAGAVARRYPWIQDYTPVNEPLTTARFSALYGHWYPHQRDDHSFARAILNQCRAVVLSMKAIREVTPNARLIQTEEVSRIHSTPGLAYQADYENERRWITYDLLLGRLTEDRPMWRWLREVGIDEEELGWFIENPCPPNVLGMNYYLSGERFLDERHDLYPGESVGGNGRQAYVDVLAARVLSDGIGGIESMLREGWERYQLPICISEVHNGGTREEQLRWLHDVWHGAIAAQAQGVDVRALTIWALLGSYDWQTLVTRDDGIYETGVFDLRGPLPRPTALATMIRGLATTGQHYHPVLDTPGWWKRQDRFIYGNAPERSDADPSEQSARHKTPRPVLIIGQDTPLAIGLATACRERFIAAAIVDIPTHRQLQQIIAQANPWAVVFARSVSGNEGAETSAIDDCAFERGEVDAIVAACSRLDIPLILFSSADAFDGKSTHPYSESCPVQVPAASRDALAAEQRWIALHPKTLLIRTGLLFGACQEDGDLLQLAAAHQADTISLTYIPDLAHAAVDLLLDGEQGIWHVANAGTLSGAELHSHLSGIAGAKPRLSGSPRMRAITSERGWLLPHWRDAMARYEAEHRSLLGADRPLLTGDD